MKERLRKDFAYFFLIFFPLMLFSRDNPFTPVISPQNNLTIKPKYFQKAKIYLGKDARILKKIVFVYQNVNGDEKNYTVYIDKNIDFHSPIIILHKKENFPIIKEDFKVLKFIVKNKKIFIKTKDKLIRNFFLLSPFRLVLDFKKESDFPTIKKSFTDSFVKKIIIGAHGNFYRVVIYLDTKYLYNIQKEKTGVVIEIK